MWDSDPYPRIPSAPQCYYPPTSGYGLSGQSGSVYTLNWKAGGPSPFGLPIQTISLTTGYIAGNVLHVAIIDPGNSRFKPPLNLPMGSPIYDPHTPKGGRVSFAYSISPWNTYMFKVTRNGTNTTLWDTSIGGLQFSDQFIQIATFLPSRNVYGFGENIHQNLRHDLSQYKLWAMFARDEAPNSGWEDKKNLYGVHPFYLCVETDGSTHGVLILNSNAQEYVLGPGPGTQGSLTYRTIGGQLDIYFFPGPLPEMVIQQYMAFIGLPMMPAYWALGFQISRWGYGNLTTLKNVISQTRAAGIPQDTQVLDIDYMDRNKDFTYDQVNFNGLPEFVKQIKSGGMRLITIVDPAIDVYSAKYRPFQDGANMNVYIRWQNNTYVSMCVNQSSPVWVCPLNNIYNTTMGTDLMLGTVWPDHNTAFPDFFKPNTSTWWISELKSWHQVVPYDGIWIDMNEPANFATNNPNPWYFAGDPTHPNISMLFCPSNAWDDPPYKTWAVYGYYWAGPTPRLSNKTLCMAALQGSNGQYKHYDVHSLYGWSESKPTMMGMRQATGKRGAVISR